MPKKEKGFADFFNLLLAIVTGSLVSAVVMLGVSKLSLFLLFRIFAFSASSVKRFFIMMTVCYFLLLLLSLAWSFLLSKITRRMIFGKSRKKTRVVYSFLVMFVFFSFSSGLTSGFVYTDAFIDAAGLSPEKKPLPDLFGLSLESALMMLNENGFDSIPLSNIHYSALSDEMPESVVVRQDPPAGTFIANSSQIELWINIFTEIPYVSDTLQTIPHLGGLPLDRALIIMASKNFSFEVESLFCDTVAANWIIATLPEGGTEAPPGTHVTVYVSLGSEIILAPSLSDLKLNEADLILRNLGLVLALESERPDPSPPNTVISQNPPPGDTCFYGDTVRVVISSGIPDTMEF
ncbi:PASTA domain-containing protein [candidate division WOR-3 bacterium]|nr:PASTA domain-containing protein [candidate division WOR-3 bacterium]